MQPPPFSSRAQLQNLTTRVRTSILALAEIIPSAGSLCGSLQSHQGGTAPPEVRVARVRGYPLRFWRRRFDSSDFPRSNSARCDAVKPRPAQLMKYVSIRTPDATPFGETFLDASTLAIVGAFLVNSPPGGCIAFARKAPSRLARVKRDARNRERQHGARNAALVHVFERLLRRPRGHLTRLTQAAAQVHVKRRQHVMVHVGPPERRIRIDNECSPE
jgi:hypothetical protein